MLCLLLLWLLRKYYPRKYLGCVTKCYGWQLRKTAVAFHTAHCMTISCHSTDIVPICCMGSLEIVQVKREGKFNRTAQTVHGTSGGQNRPHSKLLPHVLNFNSIIAQNQSSFT